MDLEEGALPRQPLNSRVVILKIGSWIESDSRLNNIAKSYAELDYDTTVIYESKEPTTRQDGKITWQGVPVKSIVRDGTRAQVQRRESRIPLAKNPAEVRMTRAKKRAEIDELVSTLKADNLSQSQRVNAVLKVKAIRLELKLSKRLERLQTKRFKRSKQARNNRTKDVSWRNSTPQLWDYELAYGPVLDNLDPDIIQAQDTPLLGVAIRAANRAKARQKSIICVADVLENWAEVPMVGGRTPRYLAGMVDHENEYLSKFDVVLTVNSHVKLALENRQKNPSEILIVKNCPRTGDSKPATTSLRTQLGISDRDPLIIYAGGINKYRGLDIAIESLQYAPGFILGIIPVPYPHPMTQKLEEMADEFCVADRVKFAPPAATSGIIEYISEADIGLIPIDTAVKNHKECTPNKMFEYVHAGIPIVTSRIIDVESFVAEQNFGEVFNYPDAKELADSYVTAYNRSQQGLYQTPSKVLLDQLSWEFQSRKLFDAIDELKAPQ